MTSKKDVKEMFIVSQVWMNKMHPLIKSKSHSFVITVTLPALNKPSKLFIIFKRIFPLF